MAKILTITLNPAIDVTIQLNELLVGEVNRQESVEIHDWQRPECCSSIKRLRS